MERLEAIEGHLAHLLRTVDDLNDIVAGQAAEIAQLRAQVAFLMQREAGREAEASGGIYLGDERPPHY
ncbi:SlyX family protein [Palleronia sp. KMU-117]|uniref:SlyX family protein n=1 Tax=Palleronia sp. KMU-117 TaxID=3434108 RepID=UPI003D7386BF